MIFITRIVTVYGSLCSEGRLLFALKYLYTRNIIKEGFGRKERGLMMKKRKWFGLTLLSLCVALGINAHAQGGERTYTFELTEENRYDPLYNMPMSSDKGSEQLANAGTGEEGLEDTLVNGWKNFASSIDVSAYNITYTGSSESVAFYWQMLAKHPEIYYAGGSISYSISGSTICSISPGYTMEQSQVAAQQTEIDAAVADALRYISDDMNDYEKALAIHDWLAVYCEYDSVNLANGTVPDESYTLYGALARQVAVCDGYSKAYQYILDRILGIDCIRVTSDAMHHAWNLVLLDGKYYHVDVTWDDPTSDRIGRVRHIYFLVSDSVIGTVGNQNHDAGDKTEEYAATDNRYQNAGWKDIDTSYVYEGGKWYAIDNTQKKLVVTDDPASTNAEALSYSFGTWKKNSTWFYSSGFAYLQKYGSNLVFNDVKAIYRMDLDTRAFSLLYTPSAVQLPADTASAVYNIYGFKIKGDTLYYSILSDANQEDTIYSAAYPEEKELRGEVHLTGTNRYNETLTADVSPAAGISGTIFYQWYCGDEVIAGANGQTYTLSSGDIGKKISVAVTVDGYSGKLSAQTAAVQKGLLTAPNEQIQVEGRRGDVLSAIALPAGYAWDAPETVMTECGTRNYAVTYCINEALYEPVTGIMAAVAVSCKEHEFDEGSITTMPTLTSTGIRTRHCLYCDATMEETVPVLKELKGEVRITGTCRYGQTLSAAVSFADGIEAGAVYQWYRDDELITGADQAAYLLAAEDIGRVIRALIRADGYDGQLTAQTETIQKAVSEAPKENIQAAGKRGKALSTVVLPQGYSWKTPDTVMTENGSREYDVVYCMDNSLYEEVQGLKALVTVSCETHELDEGIVTVQATKDHPGIIKLQCRYCDYTKEQELAQLTDEQQEGGNGEETGGGSVTGGNGGGTGDGSVTGGSGEGTGNSSVTGGNGEETGDGSVTGGSGNITGEKSTTAGTDATTGGGDAAAEPGTAAGATSDSGQPSGQDDQKTTPESAELKKGQTFTDKKGNLYKITKVSGGTVEATFAGAKKNARSVVIPDSVKYRNRTVRIVSVAGSALKGNRKLTSVTVGKHVTVIGTSAFAGCTKLKTVTLKGTKIKTFGANCLKNIYRTATVKCPKSCRKRYKAKLTAGTGFTKKMKLKTS